MTQPKMSAEESAFHKKNSAAPDPRRAGGSRSIVPSPTEKKAAAPETKAARKAPAGDKE